MDHKPVQLFVNKISSQKIISTIWLNNNHIIVCFEGNTIFLYEVLEGEYKYLFYLEVLTLLYIILFHLLERFF